MAKLTDREEAVCKDLVESGHSEMAAFMREHYTREHEVLAELKQVDVDTLYGPDVSETLRTSLKRAIADDDHALVRSLHSYCLTLNKPNRQCSAVSGLISPQGGTLGYGLLVFAALVVLIPLFLGLYSS